MSSSASAVGPVLSALCKALLVSALAVPPIVAARQTAPQPPTFRASTTLIEVDAMVKDAHGRFVGSLKPSDFLVSEDGKPQTIEAFYVVEGRSARVASGASAGAVAEQLPPADGASPPPESIRRVFVLWFDVEHMAMGGLNRSKAAAKDFLQTEFQQGEIGGIVAGGSMVNRRLTNVKEELASAIDGIALSPAVREREIDMREWPRFLSVWEASRIDDGDLKVTRRVVDRACADDMDQCLGLGGPDAAGAQVVAKARALVGVLRNSARGTLSTFDHLITGLARLPGRKTIVYFSDGFYSEDLVQQLRDAIRGAARANVRIYAVDTRGLNRGSADSRIIDTPPHAAVVNSPDIPGELPQFDVMEDGPNTLAVDTGGLMIRNENDIPRALRDIATDTSSYYVLGYRPPAGGSDGTFHTIKVSVRVPGLSVRARKGYVADAR